MHFVREFYTIISQVSDNKKALNHANLVSLYNNQK
jgi:hypothetical protein